MMRTNILREKLKSGEPTLSTHIHSTWPSVVEAIGHAGLYDYVEFVAEYAPYTLHDLDNLCRAAEVVNIDMMIKIDYDTHQFVAQKAIGSGFTSVLFADCHNVEEARHCVQSVRPDTLTDGGMPPPIPGLARIFMGALISFTNVEIVSFSHTGCTKMQSAPASRY